MEKTDHPALPGGQLLVGVLDRGIQRRRVGRGAAFFRRSNDGLNVGHSPEKRRRNSSSYSRGDTSDAVTVARRRAPSDHAVGRQVALP